VRRTPYFSPILGSGGWNLNNWLELGNFEYEARASSVQSLSRKSGRSRVVPCSPRWVAQLRDPATCRGVHRICRMETCCNFALTVEEHVKDTP
jgi:hypothetical protein